MAVRLSCVESGRLKCVIKTDEIMEMVNNGSHR